MLQLKPWYIVICIALLTSCKQNSSENTFPPVVHSDKLQQTDFVATLENSITESKNYIYCPTLLIAWNSIKQQLEPEIHENAASHDLFLLNQSKSYINALNESEYTNNTTVDNNTIAINVFFKKTLPFETKLDKIETPILFKEDSVFAFGMIAYDKTISACIKILYYKNDDHFVIQLKTKDTAQQIIFAKGLDNTNKLIDAVNNINNLISEGVIKSKKNILNWQYILMPDDVLAIPIIKFNIEHDYKTMVGDTAYSKLGVIKISEVRQRIAIVLNEKGTEIESEAEVSVLDSVGDIEEKNHPKKLILDKPFYVMMKKVNSNNPYFIMKVMNTELMIKKSVTK